MLRKQLKFFIIITITGASFLVLSYFFNVYFVAAAPAANNPILSRELLFTVEDSQGDAIGVKVMENPQRLPPLLWYNQNVSNPANPGYSVIDNYYALKDGRTTYVGATNVDTSGNEIFSYIYIFSYNEGASTETINIFNQLLENLRFNYNLNNLTEKSELQRDLLRIYDFSQIENNLDNYYDLSGHYPILSSGTYIRGTTHTTWPSWQYTLSSELGQSLPVDPINRFNGFCAGCPNDPTQPDYQCNGTCYNPTTMSFVNPYGSHVYQYLTSDNDLCAGQGYSLFSNLEYKPDANNVTWLGAENIIIDQDDNTGTYNYHISKGVGTCGDNIKDACEECEIVDSLIAPANMTCSGLGLGSGTLSCDDCFWIGCDKLNNGETCDYDAECSSGYCSEINNSGDHVCCDTACEGLCQNCAGGSCQLVGHGEDPRNVCSDDVTTCSTGSCDGFGACELKISGTLCGTGTCKYCSVDGQCLNTPSGEDYNNQCTDNPADCKAGYCNGFGDCTYYPEGFICGDCYKCSNQIPPICSLVPSGTTWYVNTTCDASGDFECYNGWGNCNGDWTDGCETSLLSNDDHCGACGNFCINHTECNNSGQCVCKSGWGDCNGIPSDGCEANFSIDDDHCGFCGNACDDNYLCCNFNCVESQFVNIFPADNDQFEFASAQPHIDVTVDEGSFYTGDDSIRFVQDVGEPYPGTCSESVCEGVTNPLLSWPDSFPYKNDCTWSPGTPSQCEFAQPGYSALINDGELITWPFTNRVMWGKAVYDVSDFGLVVGEEYVFSFYYKGYTTSDVSVRLCYRLGHCSQSSPCSSCQNQGLCDANCYIDYSDPVDACGLCQFLQYPVQTAPYPSISLGSLPKGNYPLWQKYTYIFTYTAEMANTLDNSGVLHNEVGLSVGYNDTEGTGTDLYIDDLRFKGCPAGGVGGDVPYIEDCVGQPAGTSCGWNQECNIDEECVCSLNYGDCNTNTGCETNLLISWFYCGSCAIECDPDEDCYEGECTGGGGSPSP